VVSAPLPALPSRAALPWRARRHRAGVRQLLTRPLPGSTTPARAPTRRACQQLPAERRGEEKPSGKDQAGAVPVPVPVPGVGSESLRPAAGQQRCLHHARLWWRRPHDSSRAGTPCTPLAAVLGLIPPRQPFQRPSRSRRQPPAPRQPPEQSGEARKSRHLTAQ